MAGPCVVNRGGGRLGVSVEMSHGFGDVSNRSAVQLRFGRHKAGFIRQEEHVAADCEDFGAQCLNAVEQFPVFPHSLGVPVLLRPIGGLFVIGSVWEV